MKGLVIALFAGMVLSGCGTSEWGGRGRYCDSEMLQIGPDTWMASPKHGNGCGASYKVKHAGIFCQREGKEVLVTNIDDSTAGQVIFKCLQPNDQDLKRPIYDGTPGATMGNQ